MVKVGLIGKGKWGKVIDKTIKELYSVKVHTNII